MQCISTYPPERVLSFFSTKLNICMNSSSLQGRVSGTADRCSLTCTHGREISTVYTALWKLH